MREVLAQLGLEREGELDVTEARRGLRLADAQPTTVQVEPCARRARQLGDPRARKTERREQRTASVLLVRRQRALPLARDVEQVDDLVELKERPPRLRHVPPPAAPARRVGVEQAVLDGVVEGLR